MTKLVWSDISLARLANIHDWIAAEQPAAAKRIVRHIQRAGVTVASVSQVGRPLRRPNSFVYAVPSTRYLLVFHRSDKVVTIATVLHGSQNWWKEFPLQQHPAE